MCHCSFVDGNKCNTPAPVVDSWGGYACVRSGGIWELSVLSA